MHARDDAPAETRARRAITRKSAGRRLSNGVARLWSPGFSSSFWSDTPIGPEMPG